jgi:histidinol-phosphatase (PHP family)
MAITFDMHTHCDFSTDSKTPMKEQIEAAVQSGLEGICLTDHMDYEFPKEALFSENVPENPFVFDENIYKQTLAEHKVMYPQIWIGTGVECGLMPRESVCEKISQLVNQSGWDFVIGSVHLLDEMDPYYPTFWEGKNPVSCIRRYFETILNCIQVFSDFDTLGHMDYVVRYAPSEFYYNPSDYRDITDEIMKYIIRKDIALEVNASGLYAACKTENPHPELLKRYLELGGELVTIGSDAHIPERVGGKFAVLESHLKEAGLRRYVTYKKRKPMFHEF